MSRIRFLSLLALAALVVSGSQAQTQRWLYTYGGPAGGGDGAEAATWIPGGGLCAAGWSNGGTNWDDLFAVSTDTAGGELWTYRYDGTGDEDGASGVAVGAEGSIFMSGFTWDFDREYDALVVGLTPDGLENWVYKFNRGDSAEWDEASAIAYGEGKLYVAGYSGIGGVSGHLDFALLCIDTSGQGEWTYFYDGGAFEEDIGNDIVFGGDGNIYAAGQTTDTLAGPEFAVLSVTSDGARRWVYATGADGADYDNAGTIEYGADGHVYAAGEIWYDEGGFDATVVGLTTSGNERWVYHYDGPAHGEELCIDIACAPDNSIYGAAVSETDSLNTDIVVFKLNNSGQKQWVYRYDGPGHGRDRPSSVAFGSDGNIYVAGYSTGNTTGRDFTVISLDADGNERWVYRHDGPGMVNDRAQAAVWGEDGYLYATGYQSNDSIDTDLAIVSVDPRIGLAEERKNVTCTRPSAPTFFTDQLKLEFGRAATAPVTVVLHDVAGRRAIRAEVHPVDGRAEIRSGELSTLSPGAYFLAANVGSVTLMSAKVVKTR